MNNIDQRVRYTKMIIEKNFLELLNSKPVNKITVTEICEMSNINRATFYKHYLDVDDLLEKIEEELFDQIREGLQVETSIDIDKFLVNMLNYTIKEKDKFLALGGNNGDSNLMMKTFKVCYESAYPFIEENIINVDENIKQMLFRYISTGSGSVLAWWFENGMKESPKEISKLILNISSASINGVIKHK